MPMTEELLPHQGADAMGTKIGGNQFAMTLNRTQESAHLLHSGQGEMLMPLATHPSQRFAQPNDSTTGSRHPDEQVPVLHQVLAGRPPTLLRALRQSITVGGDT